MEWSIFAMGQIQIKYWAHWLERHLCIQDVNHFCKSSNHGTNYSAILLADGALGHNTSQKLKCLLHFYWQIHSEHLFNRILAFIYRIIIKFIL